MRLTTTSLVVALSTALSAQAQQSAWSQCGGIGYTGKTTCVSGYVCKVQDTYYSQCVPGVASSTKTSSSTTLSTSVKTFTTPAVSTSSKSSSTTSSSKAPTSTGVKYLITFGDSYSQTGFDPTLTLPNSANPLGNPALPGYTTSGGLNWIGSYITQFNSSPVYSYNFAYGGATTDAKLVTPYTSTVLSFVDQVTLYLKSVATAGFVKWTAANSVFGVWIGVNDVGNGWYTSNYTALVGQIMDQYINQTQTLHTSGARNFLFLTVPPIQYTPMVIAGGDANVQAVGAAVKQYNDALQARIATFAAKNSGVKTYVVDTAAPFLTAINNPKAYGADNATCYAEADAKCLWNNDYHPGVAIQKLVAEAVSVALRGW